MEVCVYEHIRLDSNEVFYVGKGNIKRPYSTQNRNKHWRNIVNKCGYLINIVYITPCELEAFNKEKELILKYGRRDLNTGPLINLTDGGEGTRGKIIRESTKKLISLAKKGKKANITDDYRKLLSDQISGDKNYFYGKHFIGELNPFYGKKHSPEVIERFRGKNNPMYGRTGELNPAYGMKHTPEFLRMKQITQSNPVEVYNKDILLHSFECVTDASIHFKCTPENIIFRSKNGTGKFGKFKGLTVKLIYDKAA